MTAEADFGQFRAQFPTTETIVYFNSGSYGLLGNDVRAAMETYLADRIAKGADWGAWVALEDAVRERMARLLGADMNEVAVTASASADRSVQTPVCPNFVQASHLFGRFRPPCWIRDRAATNRSRSRSRR